MNDGFRAWKVYDNKREEYQQLIEELSKATPYYFTTRNDLGYDSYDDPIIKFQNFNILNKKNQEYFELKMKDIGKEITSLYEE